MLSNTGPANAGANSDETITLYAGQTNENSRSDSGSPPQQVVRHPQLLVTDNKGQTDGQAAGSAPNQLQLPQRPMPPGVNLPKPVPTRVAEPHQPKFIPGKGNLQLIFIHICIYLKSI